MLMGKNEPASDVVMTPAVSLARVIIEHYSPKGSILDPAKGEGAFYNNFPSRKKYWCEISEGKCFYEFKTKVDWTITNPSWSKIPEFLKHAMLLSNDIVFFVPITALMTKARLRYMRESRFGIVELFGTDTPDEWRSMGFQMAAIHLKRAYHGPIKMTGVIAQ